MLNPVVTLISGQVTSPFAGGVKKPTITKKHRPLVWECMLGTVYASNGKEVQYFDYDYAAAHAYAGVASSTDLRIAKNPREYQGYPSKGKVALWGVRP